MLTQPGTNVAWDYPSRAVLSLTEDEDASDQATTVLLLARADQTSGDADDGLLCARADNPGLLGADYPALWRIDANVDSSITEQATLDGYAVEQARQYHDPIVEHPFSVRADDTSHPIGTYRPGDTCQLTVHHNAWITPGTYVQRIVELSPTESEVGLTVSETP